MARDRQANRVSERRTFFVIDLDAILRKHVHHPRSMPVSTAPTVVEVERSGEERLDGTLELLPLIDVPPISPTPGAWFQRHSGRATT